MNWFWKHPLIKDIGYDQLKSLDSTVTSVIISRILFVLITAFFIWGKVPTPVLAAFIGINAVSVVAKLITIQVQKRRKLSVKFGILFAMGIAFSFAAPTSYIVTVYLSTLPVDTAMYLAIFVTGVAASGVFHLSRVYPAAIVYLLTLMLPVAFECILSPSLNYQLTGVMTFVYIVFLAKSASHGAEASIERSKTIRKLEDQIAKLDDTKEDLRKFAMEDSLTQLPNRREFHIRLKSAFNEAERGGSSVVLLIGDLDHFKSINDTSGHAAGDALLQEISKRLQATVRDYDIVARIGGDEFAIIAKHHSSPKDTADFATRLLEAINIPINIESLNITPGMSIGISMYPYDAHDIETLLSHADLALQRGKNVGRGQYYFFDQHMKTQLTTDQAMESDLKIALNEQQFELVYQPKVSIRTGQLQGFETLLRWRRSDGDVVSPGEFFPVAEDRGLMSFICDFVSLQVLKDLQSWRAMGLDPGKIAVNIHPVQIKDEHRMKRFVRDIERTGINPGDIYLEITEGCVIGRGTEDVPKLLEYIRGRGIQISLDDFGTGFASLSHLKNLPVDELKIDRSFVTDLMSNATDRAIVHAMVKLANSLGISTVAEGIETREQHNVLLAIGCTTGQGYLYNRPLSFEAATKLIEGSQVRKSVQSPDMSRVTNPRIAQQEKRLATPS